MFQRGLSSLTRNTHFTKPFAKPSNSWSQVRQFRQGKKLNITENKQQSGLTGLFEADNATYTVKLHHLTNFGVVALVPTAFILSPSALSVPVDFALGVLFPLHSHIGMNGVISDYVPKAMQPGARAGWMAVSGIMFLGLLRLNIEGPGITETVKTLWRDPKAKKQIEN